MPSLAPSEFKEKTIGQRDRFDSKLKPIPIRSADLVVDRVPPNLELEPNRFYIRCDGWIAAIQLTREEAYRAIEQVGRKRDRESIWWTIERTINGGAA